MRLGRSMGDWRRWAGAGFCVILAAGAASAEVDTATAAEEQADEQEMSDRSGHRHRQSPPATGGQQHEQAQAGDAPGREWFGIPDALPIWEWERLTGDWGGLRTGLEDIGVSVNAENIVEYSGVLAGGVNAGQGAARNLFTLGIEVDTETAVGWEGGTFFIQYLSVTAEQGGSADSGDIQVYSNIENDRALDVIYELWYEQLLFDDVLRIKVGKVDANSEFAYVAPLRDFSAAGELTNSSAGFQPTILGFPSYPDPATSINIFLTPYTDENLTFSIGYGFYDGAAGVDEVTTGSRGPSTFFHCDTSDDYFNIAEVQLAWNALMGLPGGSVSFGGWYHTGEWERFDGGTENGTGGIYATIQQQLTAPHGEDSDRGLYVFGQFGFSDEEVAEIWQVYAAGAVQVGLGDCRPDDAIGFYASLAILSEDAGFERDELALEAFYRAQLTPAVYLQPGLQYIINPSGDPSLDNAVVGQIRLGMTF